MVKYLLSSVSNEFFRLIFQLCESISAQDISAIYHGVNNLYSKHLYMYMYTVLCFSQTALNVCVRFLFDFAVDPICKILQKKYPVYNINRDTIHIIIPSALNQFIHFSRFHYCFAN